MPFIAVCPFCGRKVQAPTNAVGHSIACKKCRNHFTLAPSDDLLPPLATPSGAAATAGAIRAPVAAPAPAQVAAAQSDTAPHAVVVTTP